MDSLNFDPRTLVYDAIMGVIAGGKVTPSRWRTFSGPCCVHNGQMRPDSKKRSGLLFDLDGRTSVSCFNCGFKAGWSPGFRLGQKWERYLGWLGVPAEKIMRLNFTVSELRKDMLNQGELKFDELTPRAATDLTFQSSSLPSRAMPLEMWAEEGCEDPHFLEALSYLAGRGEEIFASSEFYWTPDTASQMNRRIIIPFYWEGEIVGYTARLVSGEGRRYMSDTQPNFIFNTGAIQPSWEYLFITEGPFDGLAINGISMLGDKATEDQIRWINQTGKTKIVVPDMVNQGGRLVDTALAQGWEVSFPKWDHGIKDAADAVLRYGRLHTVWSIIDARTSNRLQIGVSRQRLR